MNGAAAVPPRTTRTPRKITTTTIGVSHHFLLLRKNHQNSVKKPACFASACRAKSSSRREGWSSFDPMTHVFLYQNWRKYRAVSLVGRRANQYDVAFLSNLRCMGSCPTARRTSAIGVAIKKYIARSATCD